MTDYDVLRGVKLQSPLGRLIQARMQELGISSEQLGARLHYRKPAKGAGRVEALCGGHLNNRKSRAALARLASALEVTEENVQEALEATQELIAKLHRDAQEQERVAREAEDAAWRANFSCHAVIDTESKCPSQIVICRMTGGIGRWLIVRLDLSQSPVTFVRQTVAALQNLHTSAGHKCVPFFGRAVGFFINYTPDCAVRFDLTGKPLEALANAYRPGEIQLGIGGVNNSPITTAKALGFA